MQIPIITDGDPREGRSGISIFCKQITDILGDFAFGRVGDTWACPIGKMKCVATTQDFEKLYPFIRLIGDTTILEVISDEKTWSVYGFTLYSPILDENAIKAIYHHVADYLEFYKNTNGTGLKQYEGGLLSCFKYECVTDNVQGLTIGLRRWKMLGSILTDIRNSKECKALYDERQAIYRHYQDELLELDNRVKTQTAKMAKKFSLKYESDEGLHDAD